MYEIYIQIQCPRQEGFCKLDIQFLQKIEEHIQKYDDSGHIEPLMTDR